MSDSPVELDLKFLPDWLKESPSPNRYADFEGETADPRRRDDRRGPRPGGAGGGGPRRGPAGHGGPGGPRPSGPGGPGGPGGKFERRDQRGPGQGGPGGPRRDNRDSRGPRPGGPGGGQQRGYGGQRDQRDYPPQGERQYEPRKQVVKVDLLPEPAAGAGISKQIKASGRACGVFRVAKMFLDRPERYRVRISSLDPSAQLFQVGNGPVACDRGEVERGAFRALRNEYYVTETVQGEPPKGNFTTVARDRFSGALLGPSSHHGYQTALRKLYDERYSRRLEWQAFLRNIENVSDPAAIEQWKQQASNTTVIRTKVPEGEEPQTFKTEYDAEQHFRTAHLPNLVKAGRTLEVPGPLATAMLDRNVVYAVRDAVERERRVPLGIVNGLRPYFSEAGLHLFKWKRKILFASSIRPQRHPLDTTFSDGMSAILTTVSEQPGIKRPQLAAKLLTGLAPESPEAAAKKESLASDLHYLIHIGYVVEFQNGALELPPAKKDTHHEHAEEHKMDVAAEMADLSEVQAETPAHQGQAASSEQAPAASAPAQASETPATEPEATAPATEQADPGYQVLPLTNNMVQPG